MGIKDLPLTNGQTIAKVFEALGWVHRRTEKNHFVLTHANHPGIHISIPDHKEVDRYLLRTEIRKAGLTIKQFCDQYDA